MSTGTLVKESAARHGETFRASLADYGLKDGERLFVEDVSSGAVWSIEGEKHYQHTRKLKTRLRRRVRIYSQ